MSSPSRATLWSLALAINLIWAASYPLSKEAMHDFPAFGLALWRVTGGAVVLLPFLRRRDFPRRVSARDVLCFFMMGVVGCAAATALQFIATTKTLASTIALLVALETLMVMIFARLFLGERARARAWTGALIAFGGVVLISVDPKEPSLFSSGSVEGTLWMLASLVCYTVYTLTGKRMAERWGPSALTALPFLFAALVGIPLLAWWDPADFARTLVPTAAEWRVILIVGVLGAGLAYYVWNWLVCRMNVGELSRSLYFQPVAGLALSAWLLGEQITPVMGLGAALVLGGVALSEWP